MVIDNHTYYDTTRSLTAEEKAYYDAYNSQYGSDAPSLLVNSYLGSKNMQTSQGIYDFMNQYGSFGTRPTKYSNEAAMTLLKTLDSDPVLAQKVLTGIGLYTPQQIEQFKTIQTTPGGGDGSPNGAELTALAEQQANPGTKTYQATDGTYFATHDEAAAYNTKVGTNPSTPTSSGTPTNYTYNPQQETPEQYFSRTQGAINANNPNETPLSTTLPNTPAPLPSGTQTGAATPTDQNYAMTPQEAAGGAAGADAYNARIAQYNASKVVTTPSGPVGESGTMGQKTETTQVNDPYAGLDPIEKQVKMYTDAYSALGLSTIKQQFDQYTKQMSDVTNELNDKKQANQNNPWLAQGLVDRMNQQLETKYQSRLDTLTHVLALTDSLYKTGMAQVDHLVSNAQADIKATNDLAQRAIDSANAIAKDNVIQSIGGHQWLVNKSTGAKIADLGPVTVSSTSMSLADKEALAAFTAGLKTPAEKTTSDITNYNYAVSQGYRGTFQQYMASKSDPFANLFPDEPSSGGTQYSSFYDQVNKPTSIDWASLGL